MTTIGAKFLLKSLIQAGWNPLLHCAVDNKNIVNIDKERQFFILT